MFYRREKSTEKLPKNVEKVVKQPQNPSPMAVKAPLVLVFMFRIFLKKYIFDVKKTNILLQFSFVRITATPLTKTTPRMFEINVPVGKFGRFRKMPK